MQFNILKFIRENDIELVIFDIDGTIKDLYREHQTALIEALKALNILNTKRAKFALKLNNFGMGFFRIGCLPTNVLMQKLLIWIMSVVTFSDYKELRNLYYLNYPDKPILFEDMKQEIFSLSPDIKTVLASTNKYTLNIKQEICKVFCVEEPRKKIYKDIIEGENVPFNKVLIVGDNFFDDYLPAKTLKCNVHIVNMYNSRIKKKLLKKIQK